jgi:mannitol/fructose-specific phosphotransferase system IIA component (Ntr-type)
MPGQQMNEKQVAEYLNMDVREVTKLAARGKIPCRRTAGGFVFRRGQVDHWVEERMHEMGRRRLAGIEKGVAAHHGIEPESVRICELVADGGVEVPLKARTRDATIRRLVALADEAGLVYAPKELEAEVRRREELCSTAILPHVALPHPRRPVPYDIARSFLVVGSSPGGIPFGAEDGSLTRLFFFICCKDDPTHLHVLARLASVLHLPGATDELLGAEDVDALRDALRRHEESLTGGD